MNKIYYTIEWEDKIRKASISSLTMAEASSKLPMNFKTFIFHAKRLDVYNPNQSGKGMKKPKISEVRSYKLEDILLGKYPQYGTSKLIKKLLKEKVKEYKCELCNRKKWNNKKISLELHHKDGDSNNHRLENLQILCPNCHSQTDNYRGKKQPKV